MDDITVHHHYDDEFAVLVRDNLIHVDQPIEAGGTDAGPTPTELFVASLAGCAEFYVERFLRRHTRSLDGLVVRATAEMSDERPARLARITVEVELPPNIAPELRDGAMRAADHCLVHEALRHPPVVDLTLAPDGAAAPA